MMRRDDFGDRDDKSKMERGDSQIQFALGGFTVSIEMTFLFTCCVLGLLLGMPADKGSIADTALHCAAGVLGVLFILIIHEAGHAGCLRFLGYRDIRIFFYGFGLSESLVSTPIPPHHAWRVVVTGPLCNAAAGSLLVLAAAMLKTSASGVVAGDSAAIDSAAVQFLSQTGIYSLAFGFFGLIPIVPMDAGLALLKALPPEKHKVVFTIGCAVSAAAAVACLAASSLFGAVVFGLIALKNWHFRAADLAGKMSNAAREIAALLQMLEDAWRALRGGDLREAERLATICLKNSRSPRLMVGAYDVLAWTALASADPRKAQNYIDRGRALSGGLFRALTQAMISDALGEKEEALSFALAAAKSEPSSTSGKLAFRLLKETGDTAGSLKFAESFPWPENTDVEGIKLSASAIHAEAAKRKDNSMNIPPDCDSEKKTGSCVSGHADINSEETSPEKNE